MRSLAIFTALVSLSTAARGDGPEAPAKASTPQSEAPARGRALRPTGREIVRAGLDRIAPTLMGRALAGGNTTPPAALADKLGPLGLEPAFVFTGPAGLTPAGDALVAFLGKARFHALDVAVPDAARALADHHAAAPPTIPAGALEAAWSESELGAGADGGARLDAAARALAGRLPPVADGFGLEARVAAEVALVEALAQLVGGLPARPRAAAVLEDERGYYLSPDTVWKGQPAPVATPESLRAAVAAAREGRLGDHLTALAPAHPQYAALVAAAGRYAELCAAGPWPEVSAPPVAKKKGAPPPADAVRALQERLAREALYTGPANGEWDAATQGAVLEVRRLRQLKDKEPLFDADLVRVLSVPCEERVATLVANVRRWRYSAWNGETESVQVNLAGQTLRYYRDGAVVMSQRTIVGSDKSYFSKALGRRFWRNATPILHDTIATVIVNPEWNVPARIAREELEPEIAKNPDYIAKNRFRTKVGGDGVTYYIQESGPGNALGRIKILFPNDESVYLHDTPGRQAFNLPVRALSHGCVRVQNAVDFGAELVRSDMAKRGIAFDPKTIVDHVAGSRMMRIYELEHEIPVFLEYYTASVDDAGQVWFHPDVYGYDADLLHPERNTVP